MSRPSIFAEVAAAYADSTADAAQTTKALLAVAGYYHSDAATGSNSFADVIAAFTAAGVPTPVLNQVKKLFGTRLNSHV
jgi:hypothetical protein